MPGTGLVAGAQNAAAGVSIPESHRTVISTSIDIFDHDGNNIGYIQSITPSQTRNVTPVRHINSIDAGRIVEAAPGPANYTMNVNGFALYDAQNDGSLIQRIGGSVTAQAMKSLEEQSIPFNIVITETHPATGNETKSVYHDCWLTNYSHPVNIGSALIAETATIFVTWIGAGGLTSPDLGQTSM